MFCRQNIHLTLSLYYSFCKPPILIILQKGKKGKNSCVLIKTDDTLINSDENTPQLSSLLKNVKYTLYN